MVLDMSKTNAKQPAMGRPVKSDKFDRAISFPCYSKLLERIEEYRRQEGLKSQGEVCRKLIDEGLKRAGIKE
jgi:hypothetical protein